MTELRVKEYKHTIVQGSERIVKPYSVGDGRTDTNINYFYSYVARLWSTKLFSFLGAKLVTARAFRALLRDDQSKVR